jgi:hypothetical protein
MSFELNTLLRSPGALPSLVANVASVSVPLPISLALSVATLGVTTAKMFDYGKHLWILTAALMSMFNKGIFFDAMMSSICFLLVP